MIKKKLQSINLYKGMSIYKRNNSKYWWGYLRVDGRQFKKSLETTNKQEAEKNLFKWKNEVLNEEKLTSTRSFTFWADKFIELQKNKPIPPSGQSAYLYAKKSLYRTNGLVEFFGHKSVDKISRLDVEEFYTQMGIEDPQKETRRLTTSYMRKHKILLQQVLNLAESVITFKMPNPKGMQSQRRGFFTNDEYQTLRDSATNLIGDFHYKAHNGSTYTLTKDVHSAIIFLMGTMLRPTVSELMTLKFKDIREKKKDKINYLQFFVQRKNKAQTVESLESAYFHFQKMKKGANPNDYLFLNEYKNRKTALSLLSKMFIELLKHLDLESGRDGEPRTLYSLRHTSIIMNLRYIDRTDIEKRADTSPEMISQWYYPQHQLDESLDNYLKGRERKKSK